MACDGIEKECIHYLRAIHTRATFWHATTLTEAKQRYHQFKGDYTIDLGVRYEGDPGTCVCPEGCDQWLDGDRWGKTTESLHAYAVGVRGNVPHVIYYEKRVKVTEITSTMQCVDPVDAVSMKVEEGCDIDEAFALLREEADRRCIEIIEKELPKEG